MNVALICAYPASSNPGMISVDLSFEKVTSKVNNLIEKQKNETMNLLLKSLET